MEEKAKGEEKKVGVIETWLRKHRLLFNGATRHPLILSIRDGSINIASFKSWLVSNTSPFFFPCFVFLLGVTNVISFGRLLVSDLYSSGS